MFRPTSRRPPWLRKTPEPVRTPLPQIVRSDWRLTTAPASAARWTRADGHRTSWEAVKRTVPDPALKDAAVATENPPATESELAPRLIDPPYPEVTSREWITKEAPTVEVVERVLLKTTTSLESGMPSASAPEVRVQLDGVDQLAPLADAFQTKVAPVVASTVRLKVVLPASPSASVPVIVTCWLSDPVLSNDQDQVPLLFWVNVPAEAVNVTASPPASDHVPVLEAVAPAETVRFPPLARTGGRFSTTSSKVEVATAPSLSVAVTLTVLLSSGPSAVARLQDQVPLAFLTTVPAETDKVTVSAPGSFQVPVLEAVWPSPTVTGPAEATDGATLVTLRENVAVEEAPSLSVAVRVTVWFWSGPSVVR